MKIKPVLVVFFMVLVIALSSTGKAEAGESTAGDYFYGMGANLGRGLENIVTSLAEIPCTMRDEIADRSSAGVATGFGLGLVNFGKRLLIGASEVVTFFMPAPRTIPRACQQAEAAIG